MSDQRSSDLDREKRDIPSFIEPRPPTILNPFMRPKPQKGTNLLELFEEDSECDDPEWVQVYLRLRPCDERTDLYEVQSERRLITSVDTAPMGHGRRTQHNVRKMYTFSHIFGPESNQKEIFEQVVKNNLKKLPEGHNFTLLTYGASGSGKTYTLMGTVQSPGLVPRSLEYVFRVVDAASQPLYKPVDGEVVGLDYYDQDREVQWVRRLRQQAAPLRDKYRRMSVQLRNDLTTSSTDLSNRTRYFVWVSFIEIYNEAIYDLLLNSDRSKATSKLRIREDSNGNVYVKGATQAFVRSGEEAYDVLVAGKHNLQVAATGVHANSSRSHCIFTITMLTQTDEGVRTSCVRLCDLAGCERQRHARNTGARMIESRSINSSLHVLERCLNMLRRKQKKIDATLVPYRESKLTRLLGAGLSGARGECVSMVVTLNPSPRYAHETRHVLQLAAVAKDIQVNQTIQECTLESTQYPNSSMESSSSSELLRLRSDNERLHFELVQAESRNKELLAAMEEKQRETAKTMFEYVEEAKDMTRQYYESQLQAMRKDMEEMQEEYEAKIEELSSKNKARLSGDAGAGTPSRIKELENKVAELLEVIANLEDKLTAVKLARDEEVQYLRACIEERDAKSEDSGHHEEAISLTDEESDSEEKSDTYNESLEPIFKKEDLNRSKALWQTGKNETQHISANITASNNPLDSDDDKNETLTYEITDSDDEDDSSVNKKSYQDSTRDNSKIFISLDNELVGNTFDSTLAGNKIVTKCASVENETQQCDADITVSNDHLDCDDDKNESLTHEVTDSDEGKLTNYVQDDINVNKMSQQDSTQDNSKMFVSLDNEFVGNAFHSTLAGNKIANKCAAVENETQQCDADITVSNDHLDCDDDKNESQPEITDSDEGRLTTYVEDDSNVNKKSHQDSTQDNSKLFVSLDNELVGNAFHLPLAGNKIATKCAAVENETHYSNTDITVTNNHLDCDDNKNESLTHEITDSDEGRLTTYVDDDSNVNKKSHQDSTQDNKEMFMSVDNEFVGNAFHSPYPLISVDDELAEMAVNKNATKCSYAQMRGTYVVRDEEPKKKSLVEPEFYTSTDDKKQSIVDSELHTSTNDKESLDNNSEKNLVQANAGIPEKIISRKLTAQESEISLANFEELELAVTENFKEKPKEPVDVLLNVKIAKEKPSYFDDDKDTSNVIQKSNINKTYFDNVKDKINKNLQEVSKLLSDRSPSIVKEDDLTNSLEPNTSTMKILLGESFTRQPDVIVSLNKKSLSKKQASVDIFEGFDSPIATPKNMPKPITNRTGPEKACSKPPTTEDLNINSNSKDLKTISRIDDDKSFVKPMHLHTSTNAERLVPKPKNDISILEKCIEKQNSADQIDNVLSKTCKSINEMCSKAKSNNKNKVDNIKVMITRQSTVDAQDHANFTYNNNTVEEFENLCRNISPRETDFEQLASQIDHFSGNSSDVVENDTKKPKYNLRHTKLNTSDNKNDEKEKVKKSNKKTKRLNNKDTTIENNSTTSLEKPNDTLNRNENMTEEVLLESQAKCESKTKTKRNLRLRRNKVQSDEATEQETAKLKDIVNLQKEFSDVTMDKPAPFKAVKDIDSPEKKDDENLPPPILGIQSCPSKSVTRSRRKLFTPRAEPLEESMAQSGDSNERVRVPRPSYHRARVRRKL